MHIGGLFDISHWGTCPFYASFVCKNYLRWCDRCYTTYNAAHLLLSRSELGPSLSTTVCFLFSVLSFAERSFLSIWISLYFEMQSSCCACGVFSASLHNWDVDGSLCLLLVGVRQYHCVILWAVSTLMAMAFIAAFCHGVVLWFFQHRRVVIDPRFSFCRLALTWKSLTFSLWSLSPASQCHSHSGQLRLRLLFLTLLTRIARGSDPRF